jgi:hypothetical protein
MMHAYIVISYNYTVFEGKKMGEKKIIQINE